MLSAKEARDLMPEGSRVTPTKQLEQILLKIRFYAKYGINETWFQNELLPDTISELKHLGYILRPMKNTYGENTGTYYISWGEDYK